MITIHWGQYVNSEIPVTGVISNNNINWEFINDEICLDCQETEELIENNPDLDEAEKSEERMMTECDSSHTKLIGGWYLNDENQYEPNKSEEFSAIVRESVTQVVWSQYVVENKKLCSPCYPGQVDLDSGHGNFKGFTLPDFLIRKEE